LQTANTFSPAAASCALAWPIAVITNKAASAIRFIGISLLQYFLPTCSYITLVVAAYVEIGADVDRNNAKNCAKWTKTLRENGVVE
jgi:hypothetical protein